MGLLDKLKSNPKLTTSSEEELEEKFDKDLKNDGVSSGYFNIKSKIITRDVAEKIAVVNMGVSLIADSIAEMPVYLYKRNENGERYFNIKSKIITRDVAEKIAVVNMGVSLIADSIAEMPVYLYKRNENGEREKVNDYRNKLLNMNNGSYSNAYNMKKNLITDYIYHGNGYLDINRDSNNKIKSLIHIPYREISLLSSNDVNKRNTIHKYHYWGMEEFEHNVLNLARSPKYDELQGYGLLEDGKLTLASLFAIEEFMNGNAESGFNAKGIITKDTVIYDELQGYGLLEDGKLTLASLFAIEEFMNGNAESGFNAKGIITKDTVMSKASRASLMRHITKFFGGSKSSKNGGVLLLDDGMKYHQLNQSSQELELLEQKELLIKDVARHLNLPLPVIGIATSGMTYSNEQQLKLTLLKQTLSPIIRNLEETFNKYLLTEQEQESGYFFEFQYNDLLKVSPSEELKVYGQAKKDGLLTPNEVRRKINLPPISGGDTLEGGDNFESTSRNEEQ